MHAPYAAAQSPAYFFLLLWLHRYPHPNHEHGVYRILAGESSLLAGASESSHHSSIRPCVFRRPAEVCDTYACVARTRSIFPDSLAISFKLAWAENQPGPQSNSGMEWKGKERNGNHF